jgi:response regulator RpfG family c-di-GMP phosphodiesterase
MTARILFVDDEPNVLAGLQRQLRKQFDVDVAVGGEQGLAAVRERGPYAVIVSDMRMPGMNGAQFLSRVRDLAPNTVRMLLTGYADMQSAIAAVNEGHVFRFLTKPCPPEALVKALQDGIEQFRLVTAEKELLEKTLRGSIQVLAEVLSLVNPLAFGKASRVQRLVQQLASILQVPNCWQLEVAALLSQIGCVTVPDSVLSKIYAGCELSQEEFAMFAAHPNVGRNLIAKIPRLEEVATIIGDQHLRFDGQGTPPGGKKGTDIPLGARVLKVALDCDTLETQGLSWPEVIQRLKARAGWYDPDVLQALEKIPWEPAPHSCRELPLSELKPRMILAEDIVNRTGQLMMRKGLEITETVLHRLRNLYTSGQLGKTVKVFIPTTAS